ncbi:MAG: hypothetical protein ISP91_07945 [Pseudomonadales bacterium]|nr:hypothetical protein [Pseudomonadales bacterium]
MKFAKCLVVLVLLGSSHLYADEIPCNPNFIPAEGSYPFTKYANRHYEISGVPKISGIHVSNLEVFDEENPREDNAIYRFLNKVHIETKPDLIENLLLFEEGEVFDQRVMDESARLLRDQDFLYDADIRPVSLCGEEIELEVVTRDTWSLTIDASFDRSGGENNFGIGIREANLMGRGTQLSVKAEQDLDRDSVEFSFKDDNLGNSRIKTRVRYTDSDDGSEERFLLELPFYSLDSTRAWTLSLKNTDQVDAQYFRGDDVTEVRHELENYRAAYGFSKGLQDGFARRWYLGWWYRSDDFSESEELPPPAPFPLSKELSFPYVEYSSIEDKYVERVNVNQFERIEDLYIGRSWYARLGYSSEAFGGDQDRFVVEGAFRDTLLASQRHIFQHELEFSGLHNFETDDVEDVILDYHLQYIVYPSKYRSYLLNFRSVYTKNLNTNAQVVMGGENFMRAFDNRFQVGDRSVALNLERRTFTDIHLFNLIRVGWAFFVDVGRAWDPGVDTNFEDDYLVDAGFGLRLASSKSDAGRFLHIDIAFPLSNRNDPDVESSLISIRLEDRF